jgi:hypothetical protein
MDTGTLVPVHSPSQPPTCYNRVVKEKLKAGKAERRVRGTIGGGQSFFPLFCLVYNCFYDLL